MLSIKVGINNQNKNKIWLTGMDYLSGRWNFKMALDHQNLRKCLKKIKFGCKRP